MLGVTAKDRRREVGTVRLMMTVAGLLRAHGALEDMVANDLPAVALLPKTITTEDMADAVLRATMVLHHPEDTMRTRMTLEDHHHHPFEATQIRMREVILMVDRGARHVTAATLAVATATTSADTRRITSVQ